MPRGIRGMESGLATLYCSQYQSATKAGSWLSRRSTSSKQLSDFEPKFKIGGWIKEREAEVKKVGKVFVKCKTLL